MRLLASTAALLALTINQSSATDEASLKSLPCEDVTIDYNSHQRWEPESSPYGVAFEAWTPEAFKLLKERVFECSNADAQSFVAYINYLEDITTEKRLAAEESRRQTALAEEEAKKKALLEAERVRQQHQAAEEAARKRQAEIKTPAVSDHKPKPVEITSAQTPAPKSKLPLDDDVKLFVQNNPRLAQTTPTPSDDELMIAEAMLRNHAVIELSLMLCDERWSDFPGYLEEARRRSDLLRRVYIQYVGLPLDKMAAFSESANEIFASTQTSDYLLADLNGLYEICQQSLLEISQGLNFAQ